MGEGHGDPRKREERGEGQRGIRKKGGTKLVEAKIQPQK